MKHMLRRCFLSNFFLRFFQSSYSIMKVRLKENCILKIFYGFRESTYNREKTAYSNNEQQFISHFYQELDVGPFMVHFERAQFDFISLRPLLGPENNFHSYKHIHTGCFFFMICSIEFGLTLVLWVRFC